jgi:Superinfection immunity protein
MDDYYIIACILIGYFAPTIIAVWSKSAGSAACFWVNLFFGWTLIGWFVAIVFASCPTKAQIAHRNRVRLAKDEFYLREAEKARSSRVQ